jgi:glycosyltransferase involved in cell wall biosynthesis
MVGVCMEETKTQNKQKLLFLVTEDWYFVSHRLSIAMAAREAGYEVAVATRVAKHADVIEKAGIRLIPIELSRRAGNPILEFWALVKLYRREKPDIVHHVALKLVLYGALAIRFTNIAAQVNAVTGLGWLYISNNPIVRFGRPLITWFLAHLLNFQNSRVIVQNPDDEELLAKAGVLPSRIRMVQGVGVDTDKFLPASELKGPVCVVLAARLLWDKGVGEFVDAARDLKQKVSNVRFVLVGNPDLDNPASISEETIRDWEKENTVEWWGHQKEMVSVFHSAHIVCLPSYREGLPKVLIEAASCGLPIVSTDVPGCREIVRDDYNGILVPKSDSVSLSNALLRLIEDPDLRAKMGKHGRELVLDKFSSKHVILKTLNIYNEFIK